MLLTVTNWAALVVPDGTAPKDSADPFAGQLGEKTSGNPVTKRYQGGAYCANEYSRAEPAPKDPFAA